MSGRLAVPDLQGTCSACGQVVPATPAAAPYEGKARLVVHDHPRAELGRCIGSRMVTRPVSEASPLERLAAALAGWQAAPHDSVAEKDAAGEMYAAGVAVLAEYAPGLKEAA